MILIISIPEFRARIAQLFVSGTRLPGNGIIDLSIGPF